MSYTFLALLCEHRYPCEKSAINPEHLRLFHLAGRLFGRTVFEGIVADLPFANFCENCVCSRLATFRRLNHLYNKHQWQFTTND